MLQGGDFKFALNLKPTQIFNKCNKRSMSVMATNPGKVS